MLYYFFVCSGGVIETKFAYKIKNQSFDLKQNTIFVLNLRNADCYLPSFQSDCRSLLLWQCDIEHVWFTRASVLTIQDYTAPYMGFLELELKIKYVTCH